MASTAYYPLPLSSTVPHARLCARMWVSIYLLPFVHGDDDLTEVVGRRRKAEKIDKS